MLHRKKYSILAVPFYISYFFDMKSKSGSKDGALNSLMSQDLVIKGLIRSRNAIVVEGFLIGDIRCEDDVIVTPTGTVVGCIVSRCATIEGRVQGSIYVYERLRFQGNAHMNGEVHTSKLEVASMEAFHGECHMSSASEIEGMVRKMDESMPKPIVRTGT